MSGQPLKYQLTELRPEDFISIPSLNIAIAKFKARASNGKVLRGINWYDTKLLTQSLGSNYLLPTSAQWSKSREFLRQNYPELARNFTTYDSFEWVDSILAFPDKNGWYGPALQLSDIKLGKVPLLIEQSKVENPTGFSIITDGKVTEVPELPLKQGYIQDWSEDLGLPTKVGGEPNKRFEGTYFWLDSMHGYLEALVRGHPYWPAGPDDLNLACWNPYPSRPSQDVGFRLASVKTL